MESSDKSTIVATASLAIGLLMVALSWPMMKFGAIFIELEFEDIEYYSWISSAYIIAQVAFIPIAGKLIDQIGMRICVLFGSIVFSIGALFCCFTDSAQILVYCRVIQGIGAGFVFACAVTSPGLLIAPGHRNLGQSAMTLAFAVGSFFGTAIGYWFAVDYDWRYCYSLPCVIMFVCGIISYLALPKHEPKEHKTDWVGMVLMIFILGFGMYYTQSVDKDFDLFSPQSLGYLGFIIVAIAALYAWEQRVKDPVFPKTIGTFQIREIVAIFIIATISLGLLQFFVRVALFKYGMDIYQGCGIFVYLIIGGAITSVIGCKSVYRTGARPWIILGCILTVLALVVSSQILDKGENYLRFCMFLIGTGLGCIVTELLLSIQGITDKEHMGSVTSLTMGLRIVGIASGVAIYNHFIVDQLLEYARRYDIDIHWGDASDMMGLMDLILVELGDFYAEVVEEFTRIVMACCLVAAVFAALGIIVAYHMRSIDKILSSEKEDND